MTEQCTRGRQSSYTPDVAAEICQRLANGETLRAICRDSHLPAESTVRQWALDDLEGFSAQYARAREIGYHGMFDEMLEIADDGSSDRAERKNADGSTSQVLDTEHVQRSKLRVDARKWMLSKALPKLYGERITQEHITESRSLSGMSESDLDARLQQLLAKVGGDEADLPGKPGSNGAN
jgi:hypothetical protein